jgi:hypothetical protein
MKAKLEKKRLVKTLPLFDEPRPSKSGKSTLVASSRGPRRAPFMLNGKQVYLVATAYIPNCARKTKDMGRAMRNWKH